MPFLNAEAHLDAAIDSVRVQTCPDWELLLVDDGSTDASVQIAQAVARADRRIHVLPAPDDAPRGAAAARNFGVSRASGTFVAFLDADDLFEPWMLSTTLGAAEAHPDAAMVFGPTHWWFPDDTSLDWVEPTDSLGGRLHPAPKLLECLILLEVGHVPCICSVLMRRMVFDALGGFDERFALYEDQTLWVKLFRHHDVFVTPVCLSRYRQHAGSVSARAAGVGHYDRQGTHAARVPFLTWVRAYLKRDPPNPRLQWALELACAAYEEGDGAQSSARSAFYGTMRFLWRLPYRVQRRLRRHKSDRLVPGDIEA